MQELLSGSGAFVISFLTSLALLAAFITVYVSSPLIRS